MKGAGVGIRIPVEAEVCTDQAHRVPAISVLLHHADGAFQPLGDCNILPLVASGEPKGTKGYWSIKYILNQAVRAIFCYERYNSLLYS